MKLIVGPRSRWPGKYRKSLTIIPRLSRYQFSASRYFVRLQHHVSEALHPGGLARRALRRVGAPQLMTEVEDCAAAATAARRSSWVPATTRTGTPLGSTRSTDDAADGFGQRPRGAPVALGQARHVGLVLRGERRADEPRRDRHGDDHARRAGIGAPQMELASCAQHGGEAERLREGLGADQVGFLELHPRDVVRP